MSILPRLVASVDVKADGDEVEVWAEAVAA